MKKLVIIIFTIGFCAFTNAQTIQGTLTLNGKSKTELNLKTNSAVQLFKDFKTEKYKLKFNFKSKEISKNIYGETVIFFDFITVVKKDGIIVKNLQRKQPIPYFPGEMFLPAEAFDFISVLASLDKERHATTIEKGYQGTMPEGKYIMQLFAKPVGFKGEIKPLEFSFMLRKRPGRLK
ncbi:hypothetical protein [Polaribacter sp. Asnod1-A03]|uniref:hypothetical protein n=1 Tax=Polaribacter sp. Asnod1-A03 TaxID=3160581 RepID=UPI00386F3C1D